MTIDWLLLLFGCQGSNVGVIGAEHTWFISAILICYLFTPLIGFIYKRIPKVIMITILLLLPLTFAFCQPAWIYTLFNPLSYYGIAFIIGRNFDKLKYSLSRLLIAIFIAVLSLLLRFVVRYYADGTIFYDRIIVNYTHFFAALAISYIFATIFRNGRSYKLVDFIFGISFEIYLYHNMFIVGPISLFGLTSIWIVDSFIVVICTIIIAVLANITTSPFFKLIKRYDT
ncbi:MAG: acyltransferase family protein [Clostridia bacterium]|nr:acyltransferase family protein [Clostridia bacterium]